MSQHKPAVVKIQMPGIREGAVDGEQLLNDTRSFIGRFCVFPDEYCLAAATLWAAHAHAVEYFHTTPRLALLSAEVESGKTRVLEVLDLLVPESMFTLNASPAAIFRTLAQTQVTLLFDEVDAIWSKRGRDDNHEDLRALLNAGYKRGATIPRCVGSHHDVVSFNVFCAVALAGIGELPDTIMSRAIIIKMRRRAPNEKIEPWRHRKHASVGHGLREQLAAWAENIGEKAGQAWPDLPPGIDDRPAEIWEPLIAIADAAGGVWPKLARAACLHLCKAAQDRRVSLGMRLLADLRTIFGDAEAIPTVDIISRLTDDDSGLDADAPWSDLHGRVLNARKLASLLRPHGIRSTKVKTSGQSLNGYRREHLWDAWERYLPRQGSAKAEPTEPTEPDRTGKPFSANSGVPDSTQKVPEVPQVPDTRTPDSNCARCAGEGCNWCANTLAE